MSPAIETFLRTIGGIAFTAAMSAVLVYLSNVNNLTWLSPLVSLSVSTIAGATLAAFDKSKSPDGTIGFGSIGKTKIAV